MWVLEVAAHVPPVQSTLSCLHHTAFPVGRCQSGIGLAFCVVLACTRKQADSSSCCCQQESLHFAFGPLYPNMQDCDLHIAWEHVIYWHSDNTILQQGLCRRSRTWHERTCACACRFKYIGRSSPCWLHGRVVLGLHPPHNIPEGPRQGLTMKRMASETLKSGMLRAIAIGCRRGHTVALLEHI